MIQTVARHIGLILAISTLMGCGNAKTFSSTQSSSSMTNAIQSVAAQTTTNQPSAGENVGQADSDDLFLYIDDCGSAGAAQCTMLAYELKDAQGNVGHVLEIAPNYNQNFLTEALGNVSAIASLRGMTITYWLLPAGNVMTALGIKDFQDVAHQQAWLDAGLRSSFPSAAVVLGPQAH